MNCSEELARMRAAVDSEIGIIKYVLTGRAAPGEPAFHYCTAVLAEITRLYPSPLFSPYGGGASLSQDHAKVKAMGEALERYCACLRVGKNEVFASFTDLAGRALDPLSLPVCSESEYRNKNNYLRRPARHLQTHWTLGCSLITGQEVWVPSNLVWLSQRYESPDEVWQLPISTGLALGSSQGEAILSAACEVIERDAFTVFWYHQLPLQRVEIDSSVSGDVAQRLEEIEKAQLEPLVFLLPNEFGMPAFFLVLLSKAREIPALTVSTAAHPNPDVAMIKVLDEGVATRRYCVGTLRAGYKPSDVIAHPSAARLLEDHLYAYIRPDAIRHLHFLLDAQGSVAYGNLRPFGDAHSPVLEQLRLKCHVLNQELIIVDVTTADVKELGCSVVRAIMPGLEPLSQDHNIRYLGRERLYRLPQLYGFSDRARTEREITSLPHPFA